MKRVRLQNKISESSATLPLCIVAGMIIWFLKPIGLSTGLADGYEFDFGIGRCVAFALCMFTTYVIMETNNQNALIRIRTRMVSTVWVVLASILPFAHGFSLGMVAAFAMAGSHFMLLRSYQKFHAVTDVFHAFVLYSIACISLPPLTLLLPLYYWYLAVYLRSLTWRTFWAGIVGMALPLWFVVSYCTVMHDWRVIINWTQQLSELFNPDIGQYVKLPSNSRTEIITFACITITVLVSLVHFMRTRYNDKIRTRMLMYVYAVQSVAVWGLLVYNSRMYTDLMPVLAVCASPLVAHYFALTNTFVTNLFFCLNLTAMAALLILNMGIWTF